jgi:demethoxyubiquinone hydroxylase (CLK1/Coq7/Cat5 family)
LKLLLGSTTTSKWPLYGFTKTLAHVSLLTSQLKDLEALPTSHPSVPLLKGIIKEFRDDELEHLDIAVEHDSQRAPAHALLSTVVGTGCKVAIELCKRF